MFEGLRKNSQSFLLVVLVASLATIFGTQFGPGGGGRGCSRDTLRVNYIAKVYGETIPEQDFQSVARLTNLSQSRNQDVLRNAIKDGLIERELLAREATRLGYQVTDEELNREITDGYYYVSLGSRELTELTGGFSLVPLTARQHTIYSRADRQPGEPPPPFDRDEFDNWVRAAYGRTIPDYKKLMAREILAERMRNVVMDNVRVSEDEVWRDYERQHNQVAIRYLAFQPDFYRLTVRDDDQAALDAFTHEHQAEIDHAWNDRQASLHGLPAQVRIRQILLRFPDDAEEPAKLATQQRAEAIRARIAAPGGDFVRMARLYSQDESSWRGDSSWTEVDHVDLPDDVKRVLPNLQPGEVSQVIRSPLGVHIVQLVGRRQGDVSETDGKREIARELYVLLHGNELATAAANRAQQALNQPGATLDSVEATVHSEALEAFYHGPVPGPETLPGNNVLEPVSRTDLNAPIVKETQSFTASGSIPGIENSSALVRAAFQLTEQRPSPDAPVAVGDDRYLIRLKDNGRQTASREDFDRDRPRLMEGYALAKRREALQQYIARLRAEAERTGNLRIGNSPLIEQQPRRTPARGEGEEGAG